VRAARSRSGGASYFWVQVLEGAGLDPRALHKAVEVALLETDDTTELVRRKLTLVDEAVEGPQGDAETLRRLASAQPHWPRRGVVCNHHPHAISFEKEIGAFSWHLRA
jgi:hypothetical protein